MSSNYLEMRLAEWMELLADSDIAAQGRILAVCAAVFEVTGNDQLRHLTGIDDIRTLNRWKARLRDDGWIILVHEGNRGALTVVPAVKSTPVKVTDIAPEAISGGSKTDHPTAKLTNQEVERGAKLTTLDEHKSAKLTNQDAKLTTLADVYITTRAPAQNGNNSYQKDNSYQTASITQKISGKKGCGEENQISLFGNVEPATKVDPEQGRMLASLDGLFDEFWKVYPSGRKQAKGASREKFKKLAKNGVDARRIISAAAEYAKTKPDPKYTPMPTTWLNQGRWEDDLAAATGSGSAAPAWGEGAVGPNGKAWGWWRGKEDRLRALSPQSWRASVEAAKPNGTWPWWSLGPPPGDPDCIVNPVVLNEYGFVEIYRGKVVHD